MSRLSDLVAEWRDAARWAREAIGDITGRTYHPPSAMLHDLCADRLEEVATQIESEHAALVAERDEAFQLLADALEDADEFETDWNKAARALLEKQP